MPTEEVALGSFVRVFGEQQGRSVWDRACLAAGFPRPGPPLLLEQLRAVARHLEHQEGLVAVMGTALRIRVDTFENLSAKPKTPSTDTGSAS